MAVTIHLTNQLTSRLTTPLEALPGPLLLVVLATALTVESGLLAGVLVPGTALALGAGALAVPVGLPLPLVCVAAATGAVAGGQLGYRIGRRRAGRPAPFAGTGRLPFGLWERAAAALRHRPLVAVAAGQWLSYGRIVVPRTTGWAGAAAPHAFTVVHSVSATTWAAALTTLGHHAGEAARDCVALALGLPALTVVAVVAVLAAARRAGQRAG